MKPRKPIPACVSSTSDREWRQPLISSISFGRSSINDFVLDDPKVSVFHAAVELAPDGRWRLRDFSTNGTLVNGRRMTGPVMLRDGDRICIERDEYQFLHLEPEAYESLVAAWRERTCGPHWLVEVAFQYRLNQCDVACLKRWQQKLTELFAAHPEVCQTPSPGDEFQVALKDAPGTEACVAAILRELAAVSATNDPSMGIRAHLCTSWSKHRGEETRQAVPPMHHSFGTKVVVTQAAAERLQGLLPLKMFPPQSLNGHEGLHQWYYVDEGSNAEDERRRSEHSIYGHPFWACIGSPPPLKPWRRRFCISLTVGMALFWGILRDMPPAEAQERAGAVDRFLLGDVARWTTLLVPAAMICLVIAGTALWSWLKHSARRRATRLELTDRVVLLRRLLPVEHKVLIPFTEIVGIEEKLVRTGLRFSTVLEVVTRNGRHAIKASLFSTPADYQLVKDYLAKQVHGEGAAGSNNNIEPKSMDVE